MLTEKKGQERRQYERYVINDPIFISFKSDNGQMGLISDISKGGVSFEYSVGMEWDALPEKLWVDIFSSPKKLKLSNVPCRMVYDMSVGKPTSLKNVEHRRCGLEFDELTPRLNSWIEDKFRMFCD